MIARFWWLPPLAITDHQGRVNLISLKNTAEGYNALPEEYRPVTDPQMVRNILYFVDRHHPAWFDVNNASDTISGPDPTPETNP